MEPAGPAGNPALAGRPPPSHRGAGWGAGTVLYAMLVAGAGLATWPLPLHVASAWPWHHDPYLFTWVMASLARRLVSEPGSLFHGAALYPYGLSLAFSDPLLLPAVVGSPLFLLDRPVLAYNLLTLLLWPLDGLAAAWVAHRLTGSRPAAVLAAVAFCLCPYFTEYHDEFPMLLAAPIPLVLYAVVRWLETRRVGWLALLLGAIALQSYTSWYYAVVGALAAAMAGLVGLALRWQLWPGWRRLAVAGCGAAMLAAAVFPVARPYLVVRRELNWERTLTEVRAHHADLASFLVPAPRHPWHSDRISHLAETSAFVGLGVGGLALLSVGWVVADRPRRRPAQRLGRMAAGGLTAALAGVVVVSALRLAGIHIGWWTGSRRVGGLLMMAALAGLGLAIARGAETWRAGGTRTLGRGDWVRLLALVGGVFALLALGADLFVWGRWIGVGPYRQLYHLLLPLHALRTTIRFAVVTQLCLALLAALGLAHLLRRLDARPRLRRLVLVAVAVVVAGDYAVTPIWVDPVAWPRPVDRALRAAPGAGAVLEWPINYGARDTRAMLYSLAHGRPVVNGHSGVVPPIVEELGQRLPDPASLLGGDGLRAALARVFPLRFLVVHAQTAPGDPAWALLRAGQSPFLRYRGTFGPDDLYEMITGPERGRRVERWLSWDFLRHHPRLALVAAPVRTHADIAQSLEVRLDGREVTRLALDGPGPTRAVLILPPPLREAAPNVLSLTYRYWVPRESRDDRYVIGGTGVRAPGDLRIVSSGGPDDAEGVLDMNGVDLSPARRGYNLVALDESGVVLGRAGFDTFGSPGAGHELAAWIGALPAGAIVAGAVRDEGSRLLTTEAVEALAEIGVAGDLRGRYRAAHAFVGVKGRPRGTALEALSQTRATVSVGVPRRETGLILIDLALQSIEGA